MVVQSATGIYTLIATTNLLYGSIRISLVVGAQEWILACTDVRQTAVVQLDVVVCTYEHTTAVARSRVLKVLQIDVVTHLIATADANIRELAEVLQLSQKEQATFHCFSVKNITHIDIALAGAERCIACLVLEFNFGTLVQNDVTTLASVYDQVAFVAFVLQRAIIYSHAIECRKGPRVIQCACIFRPTGCRLFTTTAEATDDT